jgi:hypothetical protein
MTPTREVATCSNCGLAIVLAERDDPKYGNLHSAGPARWVHLPHDDLDWHRRCNLDAVPVPVATP